MSDAARLADELVGRAQQAGAQQAEAFVVDGRQLHVSVNRGQVDFLKEARTRGVGLRIVVDQRTGFVHSSDHRAQALADLAQRAVRLARLGPADAHAGLPERDLMVDDLERVALDLNDAAIPELSTEWHVELAIRMEEAAVAVDPRVQRTQLCQVSSYGGTRALASSNGARLQYDSTSISMDVGALAADAGGKQQGWYEGGVWRHLGDAPDPQVLGDKAARRALRRLGPRRVAPQRVPVVMHPDVAAVWIGRMSGAFSGEEVRKRTSWLSEKKGESVGSPHVTLVDDGRRRRGVGSEPFDAEGIATRRTVLIDAGVCTAFLYDSDAARRAGTRPTGSACRGYDAPPSIGTHDLCIEPGNASLEELLAGVRRGFYYVDSGSFGYNPTTGDYSFQASGFWIEDGELAYPVDEITVASTCLEMLRNIDAVGHAIDRKRSTCAPALRISEMTVGG